MKKSNVEKEKECELLVKRISKDAQLPSYSFASDVGLDLTSVEDVCFAPGEQKAVRTGIIVKIPQGYAGLIRDRAGIVSEMELHAVAGTFDSGFRGEISVVFVNFCETDVEIEKGMKIAQLIILPVLKAKVLEVKSLDKTSRGSRGFGSGRLRKRK